MRILSTFLCVDGVCSFCGRRSAHYTSSAEHFSMRLTVSVVVLVFLVELFQVLISQVQKFNLILISGIALDSLCFQINIYLFQLDDLLVLSKDDRF